MDIYIANLNQSIEEDAIMKLFEVFGEVDSVVLIRDRETRISKGYGFVKMPNNEEALQAISEMHGRPLADNIIIVKEANPKGSSGSNERRLVNSAAKPSNSTDNSSHYNNANGYSEDIPTEVIDQVSFSTTELDDGLIKVKFNG